MTAEAVIGSVSSTTIDSQARVSQYPRPSPPGFFYPEPIVPRHAAIETNRVAEGDATATATMNATSGTNALILMVLLIILLYSIFIVQDGIIPQSWRLIRNIWNSFSQAFAAVGAFVTSIRVRGNVSQAHDVPEHHLSYKSKDHCAVPFDTTKEKPSARKKSPSKRTSSLWAERLRSFIPFSKERRPLDKPSKYTQDIPKNPPTTLLHTENLNMHPVSASTINLKAPVQQHISGKFKYSSIPSSFHARTRQQNLNSKQANDLMKPIHPSSSNIERMESGMPSHISDKFDVHETLVGNRTTSMIDLVRQCIQHASEATGRTIEGISAWMDQVYEDEGPGLPVAHAKLD